MLGQLNGHGGEPLSTDAARSKQVLSGRLFIPALNKVANLYFSPYLLTSTELDDFFDAADRLGPSARVSRRRVCVGVDFFRVCVALSPAPGVDFLKGGDQDHWDDLQNQN